MLILSNNLDPEPTTFVRELLYFWKQTAQGQFLS